MFILVGALALLYLMWAGLYAIAVIIAVLFTGIKVKWSEL